MSGAAKPITVTLVSFVALLASIAVATQVAALALQYPPALGRAWWAFGAVRIYPPSAVGD